MKVVFSTYDHPNYVGGPNAGLRRLMPELAARGMELRLLFVTQDAPEKCPTVEAMRKQGFDCSAAHLPTYSEDRLRWILHELSKDPPEVFVPNLLIPSFYAARWAKEAGISTVGVMHADEDDSYALADEFVFGDDKYRLSGIVCVSKYLEDYVLSRKPSDVLVRRIPFGPGVPEERAAEPAEKLKIVYTGRLAQEQKRILDVARALCRAVREVPGTEAAIYGEGPCLNEVKKILATEGAGLPVYFGGKLDSGQIQRELLGSHVIVLLSDFEGLPVSVMEAMACGLVPVCLRIKSGVEELVEDSVSGLLVNDRGDGFVAAVSRLKNERGLWGRLSAAARARITDGYSVGKCAERWVELFESLRENAEPPGKISIPRRFNLPPVHPVLKDMDIRKFPLAMLPLRNARRLYVKIAGRVGVNLRNPSR